MRLLRLITLVAAFLLAAAWGSSAVSQVHIPPKPDLPPPGVVPVPPPPDEPGPEASPPPAPAPPPEPAPAPAPPPEPAPAPAPVPQAPAPVAPSSPSGNIASDPVSAAAAARRAAARRARQVAASRARDAAWRRARTRVAEDMRLTVVVVPRQPTPAPRVTAPAESFGGVAYALLAIGVFGAGGVMLRHRVTRIRHGLVARVGPPSVDRGDALLVGAAAAIAGAVAALWLLVV